MDKVKETLSLETLSTVCADVSDRTESAVAKVDELLTSRLMRLANHAAVLFTLKALADKAGMSASINGGIVAVSSQLLQCILAICFFVYAYLCSFAFVQCPRHCLLICKISHFKISSIVSSIILNCAVISFCALHFFPFSHLQLPNSTLIGARGIWWS